MTGPALAILDSAGVLAGMLSNGIRQRMIEAGHGEHHHVLVIIDPATGRAYFQTSLEPRDLPGVLRAGASAAARGRGARRGL